MSTPQQRSGAPRGPHRAEQRSGSIRAALAEFFAAARAVPRDVSVTFLAVAALSVVSYYYGSKRFFYEAWGQEFSSDPLYQLYEYLYWFASEFAIYFVAPLVIVVLAHRRRFTTFGLGFGDWRFGLKITAVFYAVMLPVLWIVSDAPDFQAMYPHAQLVKGDWTLFLMYESAFFLYFTGWEFVWRGYMLFGLEKHTGPAVAILAQMIPFVILHNGKPMPETFGAIVAGIALGALAIRTRSFWYCVLTHWLVMLTIDLFATLRFRSGASGIGFDALLHIVRGS